ncbi:hypothetical protein ABH942_003121 [Flavobacterium sp. 28YEA47A]|uniref:DUF6263 family protein n=1 Tax=Flavobacterium sp. 28YEA47A TaxID=3156276 RepID=UPI0035174344
MKSKIIYGFLLMGCMAILFGCTKKETIDLKLKLEVGQVDRVYVATVMKGGSTNYQNIVEMRFTTEDIKPDRNVIGVKVFRISMTSNVGGQQENYDSNKDIKEMTEEEKNMHQEFQHILNQSLLVSINNKGKIVEPFRNKNGDRRRPADQIINISNIYIPFPDEPVGLGSEWKSEKEEPLTKIKTSSTYKLTEVNDDQIIITIALKIENKESYFDNEAKGHYILDRKTCKMISGDFSMDVKDNGDDGKVFFKFRAIPD